MRSSAEGHGLHTAPEPTDGKGRRERAQGERAQVLQDLLGSLDPALPQWVDDYVFGQVWGRPGLSQDERMLVAITALAVGGQLTLWRNYLYGALQAGIPPRKIHEAIVMLMIYTGFPPTVSALLEWRKVLAKSVEQGYVSAEAAAELDRISE